MFPGGASAVAKADVVAGEEPDQGREFLESVEDIFAHLELAAFDQAVAIGKRPFSPTAGMEVRDG